MEDKLARLKNDHLSKVYDLLAAANLLEWDQDVYMPPGGAQGRAHQIGTLRSLAHQIFTSDEVGALLEDLTPLQDEMAYDSDDASLIRLAKRNYDKQKVIPSSFVMAMEEASRLGTSVWVEARKYNDFAKFQPYLERIIDLKREHGALLSGGEGNPYDALLDQYEPGFDSAQISAIFTPLRAQLIDLVKAVSEKEQVDDSLLKRHYPHDDQIAFSHDVAEVLGYDFNRGRLDLTVHPFTLNFSMDDVRITTHVNEDYLPACLMGTIHEAGHAIYEQGVSPALYRLGCYPDALGQGASMSAHESQSRFYENVIGRGRPFWQFMFPKAQARFKSQLAGETAEQVYRALNRVEPSLIRIEADEVTYGLHIMLRYELEDAMMNGRIAIADLPEIWNTKMKEYLGVVPPDDVRGVMQDIHWSMGLIGYFPDYLLGSIFSVQLWDRLKHEYPAIENRIAAGDLMAVTNWLQDKIHRHGMKFTLPELAVRATGQPLSWQPYITYLKTKAAEVYGL